MDPKCVAVDLTFNVEGHAAVARLRYTRKLPEVPNEVAAEG